MEMLALSEIQIGNRVRKDMGDIKSLADSIARHGLLHPVVVKTDGTLVAGHRRLEAARLLEWKEIPVTLIDVDDLLSAERDENTERKDFTPTEAVAIGRMIEEKIRPLVAEKRRENIKKAKNRTSCTNDTESQWTREIVAAGVGMSTSSYQRAKQVISAAESNPGKFGDLPQIMDDSGNITGPFNEMQRRKAGGKPTPEFTGERKKITGFRKDKDAPYQVETEGQAVRARAQHKKMIACISTMYGVCKGLDDLDVPMAFSMCDKDERKTWMNQARDIVRSIRKFATKLERI